MLTQQDLNPLENRSQTLIHRGRSCARSSRRTSLFLVQTYAWRSLNIHSANSTADICGTTQTYATLWNTPWVILGRMRHPLDCWTNSIGCTLGLANVCCFFKELVTALSYKYPSPHPSFSPYSNSLARP